MLLAPNPVERRADACPPQCPRVVFVALDAGGQRVLRQVARRVGDLRPAALTLSRFVAPDGNGGWKNSDWRAMAAQGPLTVDSAASTRREAFEAWEGPRLDQRQGKLYEGVIAVAKAMYDVLDLEATSRVEEQGFVVPPFTEVYVVGDLVDVRCSSAYLPMLASLRQVALPDITFVTTLFLSVARLSAPDIDANTESMAYAALKELNYATSDAACRPLAGLPAWGNLIDHCFIADRIVEGDQQGALPRAECALDIIGGFIVGLYVSNLREMAEATLLFRPRWREVSGTANCLGQVASLGYAALVMPLRDIAAYMGQLEADEMIRCGLLGADGCRATDGPRVKLPADFALAPATFLAALETAEERETEEFEFDLTNVVPAEWADRLAQEAERRRATLALVNSPARSAAAKLAIERALDTIAQQLDRIVGSQPQGWRTARRLLEDANAQVEQWLADLPDPEVEPNTLRVDHELRVAVAGRRPLPALLAPLLLLCALAIWVSISLPIFGAPAGLALAAIAVAWVGWSQLGAIGRAKRLARSYIHLINEASEIRLRTERRNVAAYAYGQMRRKLGVRPSGPLEGDVTEAERLRAWQDTLAEAASCVGGGALLFESELYYGERPVLEPVDLGKLYDQEAHPDAIDAAVEFLRAQESDPSWNWRLLDSDQLIARAREFCMREYLERNAPRNLTILQGLALVGRNSERDYRNALQMLRNRSEPLVRWSRLNQAQELRRRFLLIDELQPSPWVALAGAEALTPVPGGPSSYLAILQLEPAVAIADLLVLPRLRASYERLSDRGAAHGVPEWADMPEAESANGVDTGMRVPEMVAG